MDYLGIRQLDTYASAMAGRGVQVVWDTADAIPRTDNKTIWIPRVTSMTSAEQMMKLRMFIKHEASHCVDSDFDYLKEQAPTGFLAFINNVLEDYRIDFRNDAEYPGDVSISDEYYAYQARHVISSDKEKLASLAKLAPLFAWDADNRSWIASAMLFSGAVRSVMSSDPVALSRYSKLKAGTYTADMVACLALEGRAAAEAVMALAKRILLEVYSEEAAGGESATSKAEGGKGSAEGEQGEGESGGADGEADDGEGKEEGGEAITEQDIVNVSSYTSAKHEPTKARTATHLTSVDKKSGGGWVVPPFSDYEVLSGDRLPEKYSHYGSGMLDKNKVLDTVEEHGKPLAAHLRMRLQTRSRARYMPGMRSGKLHSGSLHKLLSGNAKQAERVFKTKVESDTLDTAVLMLVDCSGSMGQVKFQAACATAMCMSEALRPLNIAHSVLGFTSVPWDAEDKNLMRWFKGWDERVTNNQMFSRFNTTSDFLSQNADGDALVYAYASLMQRKEHRKMLIVLSDGSPCGRDWAGNGSDYLKQVVKTITTQRKVDLYGIGILDTNVSIYYPKHSVLKNLSELAPTVLSVLDI